MGKAELRTYGRTKGRTLKPRRARLLEARLPQIGLPAGRFDPGALAPSAREIWLEVGFGGGEHLAAQAARRPDALVLGAEPFVNGVAALLARIESLRLENVRLHPGDARALTGRLPDATLDRIFILFPDPWPKTRHWKRRLIEPGFLDEAARTLKSGGRVRFATDWADYANWALARFLEHGAFRWTAERAADWRAPPIDHVTTRYQEKALGDCAPVWLEFVRT